MSEDPRRLLLLPEADEGRYPLEKKFAEVAQRVPAHHYAHASARAWEELRGIKPNIGTKKRPRYSLT